MEQRQWGKKCVQKDNRLPIFYNAKTFESVRKKVITLVTFVRFGKFQLHCKAPDFSYRLKQISRKLMEF